MRGAGVAALVLLWQFGVAAALAQAAGSDWSKVEALGQGTKIRVSATSGRTVCKVERVDSDSLRCEEVKTVFFVPVRREHEFPRRDVRVVKLSKQGVSILAGTAIGLGAGAGIGAAIDASAKDQAEEGHLVAIVMGLFGALIGAGIGEHTDFAAGPVVYRAP